MELALSTILLLAAVGAGAGMLGAMVGIGGGVLVVPAVALLFDVDSQSGHRHVARRGGRDLDGGGERLRRTGAREHAARNDAGDFDDDGGIVGGLLAVHVSQRALSFLFAALTVVTAVLMLRSKRERPKAVDGKGEEGERILGWTHPRSGGGAPCGWEEPKRLAGAYFDERAKVMVRYQVVRVWVGAVVALVAGILSGMLGIGGGFLKVPAMHLAMRVPLRVAAATSNVMIGVTAIASLFVYFARGYVHPTLVAPVVLGVVAGSLGGTVLSAKALTRVLRFVLAAVLVVVAVEMVLRAQGVRVV